MILKRFFKPKWQHPNPEVRKHALQEVEDDNPILVQLAQQDSDMDVRCTALKRIAALEVLAVIARQETDARVRACADSRLREVLAGHAADSPPLALRLEALASLDTELIEFLALEAQELELRVAALKRIQRQCLLSSLALNDPAVAVRLEALARVSDPVYLEQIAKQSRNRDKRVYRQAQERLHALQTEKTQKAHMETLCRDMEQLTWDSETGPSAAHFVKLEKAWQALPTGEHAALRSRYEHAREKFLAQRQASVNRRVLRVEICKRLQDYSETLQQQTELTPALESQLAQTVADAERDWAQWGEPEDSEGRRLQTRFDQLLETLRENERRLRRDGERSRQLRAVLHQAEALLRQPSAVLETDISGLKQHWGGLEHPENHGLVTALQGEFDAAMDKLQLRLQRQAQCKDEELRELQELQESLEKALEEGELQQAISLYDKTQHRLNHNVGLSRKQMLALQARLHGCHPRLAELRGWRRWGTDRAREQLCEAAEQLYEQSLDPMERLQHIKNLRAAWKRLDSTEGGAPRSLWKRFDRACERAYEPCQAYFDAQAQERQHNLAKKHVLCERIEQMLTAADWDQVDWRWADRSYREFVKEWDKIGPVNRADRKAIERRYTSALKQLDQHLKPERERELQRRRALIQKVKDLAEGDDLQAAVAGAKKAQTEWQPTVQASRREEQALWRQFRGVCDGIFAHRQAEQQAMEAARQQNLARRTALCEELEALAEVGSDAIAQARRRVQEAQQEWATMGSMGRSAQRAMEQRFETACFQVKQRERTLRQQQARAELQTLAAKAALCQRLEALLWMETDSNDAAVADQRSAWEALPLLTDALEKPIQERFDGVCQALIGEDQQLRHTLRQSLEQNLQQKQNICLQLEVFAGVESPAEFQQARMEYQVARLSQSLHSRELVTSPEKVVEEVRRIETTWYLLPSLPPAQEHALEQRFKRALSAFYKG